MTVNEILELYKETAFLPFGMQELLLEREAELMRACNEPFSLSAGAMHCAPTKTNNYLALEKNQGTRDGSAL